MEMFGERKDNSSEIAEAVISQLLDEALSSSDIDTLLDNRECIPYNEEDIVKRIKDFRRIYDSRTSESDMASTVSNCWIESLENKVDDNKDSVDVCDSHWKMSCCDSLKRKRSVSPCYFGNIDISPVKKLVRSNSPTRSTKSTSSTSASSLPPLPCINPWFATEAPPTIFWSNVKSQARGKESDQMSFVGSDDNPEEEVQMAFSGDKVNSVCDLRELLNQRGKGLNQDQTCNLAKQENIFEKYKVTGKDAGTRKVLEINEGGQISNYEASECEEGEILDYDDMDYQDDDNQELAPVYRGYRMNDLVRKKKVLEHLIEMAKKEECEASVDDVSFESRRGPYFCHEKESNVEENTSATNNVTTLRKVVFRGSSPDSNTEIRENILKDFTAEMDKRMSELFHFKEGQQDISIKVEPVSSDEEESNVVSEEVTKHMMKEASKSNSPWSCKYKSRIQVDGRSSISPLSYKYECSICKVTVGTKLSMKQHRKGRRHKFNIEREKYIWTGLSLGYENYRRREVGKNFNRPSGKPREGGCESADQSRGVVRASTKLKHSSGDHSRGHGGGIGRRKIGVVNNEVSKNEVTRSIKVTSGKTYVNNDTRNSQVKKIVENKDSRSVSKPTRKRIVWDLI